MRKHTQVVAVVVAVTALVSIASAGGNRFKTNLSGYDEAPLALSTGGNGTFEAVVNETTQQITYTLTYAATEGSVTQAHIHFGTRAQSGGIATFLCTNLGNGPAGTQACPAAPATVTGTIVPSSVIGPNAQGISAGEFSELVAAMRQGAAYVNVHTSTYPGGEIRGALGKRR